MQLQGRMKTSTHCVVGYAFDELLHQESLDRSRRSREQSKLSSLRLTLTNLTQTLLRNSKEPRIRKTVDRTGNLQWNVYDPQGYQSLTFNSELEVRQWLDQRYYQPIG